MKQWTTCAAVAALIVTVSAGAAPAGKNVVEKSPDVLSPAQLAKKPVEKAALPLVLAPSVLAAAASPTVDEVGDVESFGKNVIYLGLAQTLPVTLVDDCTGSDPTTERCIVQNPAPASTTFIEGNLATMSLPAKATKSLLCFTLTPFIFANWQNNTGASQIARFNGIADITISNPMLSDPTLIDPNTGLPFGGSIQLGLTTWSKTFTLHDGDIDNERSTQSRACIAGILSQRALIDTYGFTAAQAKDFFKKPITLTFGSRGTVSMTTFAQYFYGFRVYGDN